VITVDHLRDPGRASRRCALLGTEVSVPTAAARLASLAGIPLVPLTVRWAGGQLHVTVGAAIACQGNPGQATEALFRIVSGAIERDPASWAQLHRFLRRARAHPQA
jgi:lauroyl/myristoyl acyltransferase